MIASSSSYGEYGSDIKLEEFNFRKILNVMGF